MKFLIFFLLVLSGCASKTITKDTLNSKNLFDLSMDEYKEMLINYNENKDFPDIDE